MKSSAQFKQSGFSLIELLIVIIIIGLIASFAFSRFLSVQDAGAGERVIQTVAAKIGQRRDEAIRLNGLNAATSLENEIAPLVVIDFSDSEATASLITDGTDADGDGRDDATGARITRLQNNVWQYSYRPDAIEFPGDWAVSTSIAPVGNGSDGRGVPVTRIGFDGAGRAYGYAKGAWQKYPSGSSEDTASTQNTPFWAVYAGSGQYAVAVAVYPSGQTEKFRFDGVSWRGWRARIAE